jgi:CRISPR-associated protein Csd1
MILQALCNYYQILKQEESDVAPEGYTRIGISFALEISKQGNILGVIPLYTPKQGKKKSGQELRPMIVPRYVEPTSNVEASFLCGKSAYVLGISEKDEKKPKYSADRFKEFCRFNKELLSQASCEAAKAVIAFLDNHNPATARVHPEISRHLEEIMKGARFIFRFENQYVHEVPEIKQVWETYYAGKDAHIGQCLVTGEIAPLAHLHSKIKGVKGTTAGSLVSFNEPAFRSYGRRSDEDKGLNAPVSQKAEFAYTTALNHLLASEKNKFYLDDTTVVYWAENDESVYAEIFGLALFNPEYISDEDYRKRDKSAEKKLGELADKVKRMQNADLDHLLDDVKGNPRFYVLGLSPNQGRIAVKFFISEPFRDMLIRINRHYQDMKITKTPGGRFKQPNDIGLPTLLFETVSPKASVKEVAPLLEGAVTRAILTGSRYPDELYYAIINRIRADVDDEKKRVEKISYVRVAIIKSYFLRKYSQIQNAIKEVLTMSLNEQSTYPPYVLGRLFAVLEKTQKDAYPKLNTTIKDRYFTSACAAPASVFPTLLRLAQHHISKDDKYGRFNDSRIEELENLLKLDKNPLPARLTLDEQGVFILGYYHQRAAFYAKNDSNAKNATQSDEFNGKSSIANLKSNTTKETNQ